MKEDIKNLPTLEEGAVGDNVIILQNKLKILGFFDASVTGSFGIDTKMAVEAFQEEYDLPVTGIVDSITWDVLYEETKSAFPITVEEDNNLRISRPTLRIKDTGEYVVILQNRLKELLFYDGEINGIFDSNTETAVKVFQTINKLTSSGVVDIDTWSALDFLYEPLSVCSNTSSDKITYVVRRGDTLYSIARIYGVSINDIKRLNNLSNNILTIGEELIIKKGSIPETNINEDIYIVKSKDTLYSIAVSFNTTVDEIKRLNNKTNNIITIGEELIVPSVNNEKQNTSTYIVKSKDTLYSIAQRFNTTVDNIKKLNNLNNNILTIGQELIVPSSTEGAFNYNTYIVKRGDTLYSIAREYNVSVNSIKELNNLTSNILNIGQQLLIPNV